LTQAVSIYMIDMSISKKDTKVLGPLAKGGRPGR